MGDPEAFATAGVTLAKGTMMWKTGASTGALDWMNAELAAELTTLERTEVTSPEKAADVLLPLIGGSDREMCVVLLVDTKHRLLRPEVVSVGSLDRTFMSPREIFRVALVGNAAAVVVGHNHPSGDPEPSRDDEAVTRRLVRSGEMIGVEVLDHLVVGGSRWVSLARRGMV